MKNIKMSEILKDAGLRDDVTRSGIHTHIVTKNDETFTVTTKDSRVSLAISGTPNEDGKRFALIKAIYDKAKKFGGNIIVSGKRNEAMIVSVIGENQLLLA